MPILLELSSFVKDFADLPNWVGWDYQYIPGKDKPKKPPYSPITGRLASATDPATWATWAQAIAFADAHHMAGIGLVLTRELGITLVDLDDCFDGAGELLPWAAIIVAALDSYTEYSPSGKGLHVLCYGATVALKTSQVELYSDQRYTTITGQPYGAERPLRCAQAELDALRTQYAPTEHPTASTQPPSGSWTNSTIVDASDETVIATLRSIPAQAARWAGNVIGDRSRHLFGLINGLIWLVGDDPVRIGRLMRQSGLYDPIRHEKNSGAGYPNLDVSIFNACRTWQGTPYKWPAALSAQPPTPTVAPAKPEPAEPTLTEQLEAARIGLRYGKLALMSKGHSKDTDLSVAETLLDIAQERNRLGGLAIGLECLRKRAGLGSTSTARSALRRLGWLVTREAQGDHMTRADVYDFNTVALDWLSETEEDLDIISTRSHVVVNSSATPVEGSYMVRSSGNIRDYYSHAKSQDCFSTGWGVTGDALGNQTPGASKLTALLIDMLIREGLPMTGAQLAELTGRNYKVVAKCLVTAHELGLLDRQKESKAGPGRRQYWYSAPGDIEQRAALATVDMASFGVGVDRALNGAVGLLHHADKLLRLDELGKAKLDDSQRATLRTWLRLANIECAGLRQIVELGKALDKREVKKTIAGASGAVLNRRAMQAARQFSTAIAVGDADIKQSVRLFGYWAGLFGYYDLDTTGDSGRQLVTEALKQVRRQAVQQPAPIQPAPMGWDDLQHSRQVERATAHQERFGVELVYAQEV